jgi:hypothetical protein
MVQLSSSLAIEKNIESFALIAAPVLFAASTFFWEEGEYNYISGTLIVLSMFFWLPAFTALFRIVSVSLPRYAVWGLWISYFGCISGVCFAFLGYITDVLNISHKEYLEALNNYLFTSQLLLFGSGPIFPLSILVYGIQTARKRTLPFGIAILFCIAGVAFPLSRVPRIEWIAHVADLILLVPCLYISFKGLHRFGTQSDLVQKPAKKESPD